MKPLKLDHLPSQTVLSLKALATARRRPPPGATIPPLAVEVSSFHFDPGTLRAYREICGFAQGTDVPIPYPQVSAIALQMFLLSSPEFPLPLLGLVHLRNTIRQDRVLGEDENFGVSVSVGNDQETERGLEFELRTRFVDGSGATPWESAATVLYRRKKPGSASRKKPAEVAVDGLAEYSAFDAPGDIGRRYGRIAGDMNPIHLYPLTAKLFGFRRHIAHGMWSMARCCALLQQDLGRAPRELNTQFRQPLFLPGRVALRRAAQEDGFRFALLGRDGGTTHLEGSVR